MFVRRRGVWFEFAEKMFVFLGEIQKTWFLAKTTLILLFIHLQTMAGHYGFLRYLAAVVFVSNTNVNSCLLV